MTLKKDAKFEKELTGGLENDLRNLANFDLSIWKSQNWDFDLKRSKIWREIDLSFQNWHEEFDKFDPSTRKSKTWAL